MKATEPSRPKRARNPAADAFERLAAPYRIATNPEVRYTFREAVQLAFVVAIQQLLGRYTPFLEPRLFEAFGLPLALR